MKRTERSSSLRKIFTSFLMPDSGCTTPLTREPRYLTRTKINNQPLCENREKCALYFFGVQN